MTRNTLFLVCSMLAAGFAVLFTGCTAFGPMPTGNACTGDADDGVSCTVAQCDGDEWRQVREDGLCDADEVCHLTQGCVPRDGTPDCDDDVACTADSHDGSECMNEPIHSRCPSGQRCGSDGCFTPPTDEECETNADCVDTVSCTTNRCRSDGMCDYSGDACPTGQHCSASADACVDDTPPTGDRFCADGQLIGERVRLSLTGMSGIRSFADRSITGANAGTILWNFYGTPNTFAPGSTVEMPVVGGTINVHFNDGGSIAFDSRMANLQSISTATDDVTGEARGITAEVYRGGRWVPLPVGFLHFGWDTNPATRWGESGDPLVPTGDTVGRLLLNTDCETQGMVYEATTGRYRPAR